MNILEKIAFAMLLTSVTQGPAQENTTTTKQASGAGVAAPAMATASVIVEEPKPELEHIHDR